MPSRAGPPALALIVACLTVGGAVHARAQDRSGAGAPATEGTRAEGDSTARRLLLTGRYDEARAAYERLSARAPVAAAIGVARSRVAVGGLDEALKGLAAAAAKRPAAALSAEIARLEFERGNHAAAQVQIDSALARDPDLPSARYLAAELHRVAGRLDEADVAYRWLVRYYNREQDRLRDPETMRWIGLGAAQYARWNRNSGQFHFLIQTLYPDALALDPGYWPAHLESALLFTEKYNQKDAADELAHALAINPRAAELHAARARLLLQQFDLDSARAAIDRALAIDARLLVAHQLDADLRMVGTGPRAAVAGLERARALNPADEETLGRLAAVYGVIDGAREGTKSPRMDAVVAEAVRRNPHCGTLYAAMGASFDLLGKYPHAARAYEEARRRMPQLVAVPGQLGLQAMRLGDEDKARTILKEAFAADPFNIRVKNSLAVLEVLEGYGTIETEHFIVRFDRGRDSLLARYAARHLEGEVYPEVTKALGHAPRGKSLFEIFSRAKGSSGHAWFSTRMVGLPFIGTVGACAGQVVAIASPTDGAQPFNWARVLKHEFVHLVNLQQTDFNIPRWTTEALAVRYEGPGRPRVWDQVLARRAAADRLFDLGSIHLGFVRPSTGEDWALAYCQAELYARYIADTHGEAGLARLIGAYAERLETPAALERCCGTNLQAFEKGYRSYVERIVRGKGEAPPDPPAAPQGIADMVRDVERRPNDAALLGRLSRAMLARGDVVGARARAEAALAIDPRQPEAAYVMARVLEGGGDVPRAREVLRAAFDPGSPRPELLTLLAELALAAKDWDEAERLARLGGERFPLYADWDAGLVEVYRQRGARDSLAALLARRAERESDDFGLRMELTDLAARRGDHAAAARWALEAIHVDVMNPDAHTALGRALGETKTYDRAIEEHETAIALDPESSERRLALAKTLVAAGRTDRARQTLGTLLERDANHAEARRMLDSLGRQ